MKTNTIENVKLLLPLRCCCCSCNSWKNLHLPDIQQQRQCDSNGPEPNQYHATLRCEVWTVYYYEVFGAFNINGGCSVTLHLLTLGNLISMWIFMRKLNIWDNFKMQGFVRKPSTDVEIFLAFNAVHVSPFWRFPKVFAAGVATVCV